MTSRYSTLEHVVDHQIMTLWLNRPEVHNAFNSTMLQELVDILETVDKSEDIRVLIVSGRGKSFSAGADLNWMKEMIDYSYQENLEDSLMISKVFFKLYNLKQPVIAAINGAAIGGGMGFVGASDIVVAAEHAVFSLSEVKIGVVPACISPYLLKKTGEGALKELFISGQRFDCEKAGAINLVNYSVPAEQLMDFCRQKAHELLVCGPKAIALCKQLFKEIPGMPLAKAHDYTAEIIARLRVSDEAQEGMKAFLNKRTPNWHPDKRED